MKRTQVHAAFVKVSHLHPLPAWRVSDPSRPFCVECGKANGVTWTLFARYTTMDEATAVRDRLVAVGCPARVLEYDAGQ